MEVKEFGIKFVVLEPGMINTGFNATVGQNFSYKSKYGAYSRLVNGYIKAMKTIQHRDQNQKLPHVPFLKSSMLVTLKLVTLLAVEESSW